MPFSKSDYNKAYRAEHRDELLAYGREKYALKVGRPVRQYRQGLPPIVRRPTRGRPTVNLGTCADCGTATLKNAVPRSGGLKYFTPRCSTCRTSRQREKMFVLFGRECLRCGYDQDPRALQLDHVANDGAAHRAQHNATTGGYGGTIARWALKHPAEALQVLQVLCANCNHIKEHERKRGLLAA